MRIVLLGAPGSGKGTQAALMVERLGMPHISTGVLLRNAADRGAELGLKAKSIIDKGELVPDEIMTDMIEERLSRPDVANGFILDGYPRNLAQAKSLDVMLKRLGQPADIAIQLDVDADQIVKRLAGRAELEGRADDNQDVVRNRMRVYHEKTARVIDYYANRGLLTHVLGDGKIAEVLERILSALSVDHSIP